MTLDRAVALAEDLSRLKRLATGLPCAPFPSAAISRTTASFEDVTSALYKWYWEELREDRNNVGAQATQVQRVQLAEFEQLLKDQRHVDQHAGYSRAAAALQWRTGAATGSGDGHPSADPLTTRLLSELCLALELLCELALLIGRDPDRSLAWRQITALSPEQEVLAVFRNLGRHPQPGRLAHAVRQYTGHPDLRRARSPRDRARIAEAVVLGTSLQPLTVDYEELLDSFGLIGDQAGYSLLLLAHAVQAWGHRETRVITVVESVWPLIRGK